jgi:hypothetical protein
MPMIKRIHSRLLLMLIFGIACVRMVARILPITRTARLSHREAQRLGVKQGILVRSQGYTLHATGNFPYVRVAATDPAKKAPVPVEIAALSSPEHPASGSRSQPILKHKQQPTSVKPFCDPACDDCNDCTECGCTDCTDCGTDCACTTFTTTSTDVCA